VTPTPDPLAARAEAEPAAPGAETVEPVAEASPATVVAACPQCGEPVVAGEAFCEACGASLGASAGEAPADPATADAADSSAGPAAETEQRTQQIIIVPPAAQPADPMLPCTQCGSTEAADGYCNQCGSRMPVWRDHFTEQPATWAAGVCDRGISHARNEDAMALGPADAATKLVAFVVCDGVTSAPDSDVASLAAARAARSVLEGLAAQFAESAPASPALRVQALCQALVDSGIAAQAEAKAAADRVGNPKNPPSCTFAAAVAHDGLIAAGWVGDSRVYWLPDEGEAQQLSIDDSWATQQIAQGVARDVAEADPQAHAITRWLGADSPATEVLCATVETDGAAGWLLVCSDGLWNYVSPADDVRAMVLTHMATDPSPLAISEQLVAFANSKGGHDNITAALARLPIPTS
jgi:serine/threonine protein phosphatase PrpC